MKHLYHLGILQVLTLPLTAVRNDSPKVTVSWELGMGSCTMALPPAADPLAQTEGNTTSGESLGPSPTSAQPLLIQSSTSSLYRRPQPEPSSQGHPRTSAPDTTDDSSPSPQTHHSGRRVANTDILREKMNQFLSFVVQNLVEIKYGVVKSFVWV